MTFSRRLTLLAALCASAGLHAQPPLSFSPCADTAVPGSLCAVKDVYGAYDERGLPAAGENLELFVRKIPAEGKATGTLWLVAGGPGESGATFYSLLPTLRRSFPGFDLLIPDHRGTGNSTRLCPAEEAEDSPGGRALAGAEWASCFASLNQAAQRARQFSISNAANDLQELIRDEHYTDKRPVYLYGVSYGTQLILRSLQLRSLPVKGIILDSLTPPQGRSRQDLSYRSHMVDRVGLEVLEQCDEDRACHALLGEDAAVVQARVLDKVQADPALLAKIPGKNLKYFMGSLLDVPAARARIPYLLRDLDQGGDTELAAVRAIMTAAAASLGDYAQSPLSVPLAGIISNSENNLQPFSAPGMRASDIEQGEAHLLFASPLPGLLLNNGLPTYRRDDYYARLPMRIPRMLVLQGTWDAKTPYRAGAGQVGLLQYNKAGDVSLSTVQHAPHFILWTAPACFEQAVTRFIGGKPARDCTL